MPQAFPDQALVHCSNEADALGTSFTLCHRVEEVENGTFGEGHVKNQPSTSHLQLLFLNPKLLCPPAQGSGWKDFGVLNLLLCFSH